MKLLVDLDGQGACWVFRGDEDDVFEFVEAGDADQSAEFEGDYWTVSTEAVGDMGINVRKTPCMSGSILGTVWAGDEVLATRERSGSWMKLICWEEQRTCWVFRGNEDDLFQFDAECGEQGMNYVKETWNRRMQDQKLRADCDAASLAATEYAASAADSDASSDDEETGTGVERKLHDLQLLCEEEAHTIMYSHGVLHGNQDMYSQGVLHGNQEA